jgi:hypothetical protein
VLRILPEHVIFEQVICSKARAGSEGYLVDIAERQLFNIFKCENLNRSRNLNSIMITSKYMHQLENHVQIHTTQ